MTKEFLISLKSITYPEANTASPLQENVLIHFTFWIVSLWYNLEEEGLLWSGTYPLSKFCPSLTPQNLLCCKNLYLFLFPLICPEIFQLTRSLNVKIPSRFSILFHQSAYACPYYHVIMMSWLLHHELTFTEKCKSFLIFFQNNFDFYETFAVLYIFYLFVWFLRPGYTYSPGWLWTIYRSHDKIKFAALLLSAEITRSTYIAHHIYLCSAPQFFRGSLKILVMLYWINRYI